MSRKLQVIFVWQDFFHANTFYLCQRQKHLAQQESQLELK